MMQLCNDVTAAFFLRDCTNVLSLPFRLRGGEDPHLAEFVENEAGAFLSSRLRTFIISPKGLFLLFYQSLAHTFFFFLFLRP